MPKNRHNAQRSNPQPNMDALGPSQAGAEPAASSSRPTEPGARATRKRKGHRGGKKKRSRRKSFAMLDADGGDSVDGRSNDGFYQQGGNLSGTSIDSQALLDHRDHQPMRVRRSSTLPNQSPFRNPFGATLASGASRLRNAVTGDKSKEENPWDETAPLLSEAVRQRENAHGMPSSYGTRPVLSPGRPSRRSSGSHLGGLGESYDVNHPPSMPNSPNFGPTERGDLSFGDVMITDDLALRGESPHATEDEGHDAERSTSRGSRRSASARRRDSGPDDVCIPGPGMSELGEEDLHARDHHTNRYRTRRRRGQWPDLSILEEWKHFEKEGRTDERRVKNITEPQLINGRLRPVRKGWFQTDEEVPYRFTYFNEEFETTIHSQTISELCQPGGGFQELFIPDLRVLSDDEDDSDDETAPPPSTSRFPIGGDTESKASTRNTSIIEQRREQNLTSPPPPAKGSTAGSSKNDSGRETPVVGLKSPPLGSFKTLTQDAQNALNHDTTGKTIRYGDRPVWWLDVLSPTESEMKVISKAFGIHPLTAEDIMLEEAREKVELFRHYYFVNYRTFDQDINSPNFLEPVNMYVVVFREGVLSFHFSMTPHPANVRRRIRQLRDYLILSSDWISYAIIDDITDVFQPLIQNIEDEVDEIDDSILQLHSSADKRLKDESGGRKSDETSTVAAESSGDMLRRVGDCRKRVMSLYRLLGNKADVIKGFAKRCNERWEVAPRSEIGLYLGDIQDHIITMTSNLSHYEKILARSHGNYLAQINIRMNERQEQTADVLGKLTVLGTIVLPMNIITGLWGMNVWVPGQEYEGDLTWFVWITAGLICFGLACYMIAKRVYQIV